MGWSPVPQCPMSPFPLSPGALSPDNPGGKAGCRSRWSQANSVSSAPRVTPSPSPCSTRLSLQRFPASGTSSVPSGNNPSHVPDASCTPSFCPDTFPCPCRLGQAPLSCWEGKLLGRADKGGSPGSPRVPRQGHRSLPRRAVPDNEPITAGGTETAFISRAWENKDMKMLLHQAGSLAGMSLFVAGGGWRGADGGGRERRGGGNWGAGSGNRAAEGWDPT